MPISKRQIVLIKTLQSRLGWDDATYRTKLYTITGKRSCKVLTPIEFSAWLGYMQSEAVRNLRQWTPTTTYIDKNYAPSDRLTRLQRRTIRALWQRVSKAPEEHREAALQAFIKRQTGVDRLEWVPRSQAHAIICALKTMEASKYE